LEKEGMHMKPVLRLLLPALMVFALAQPAFADPMEEAVAAYNHAEYGKALKILTPLAKGGNSDAQYTLGQMYLKGSGVPEDKAKAYMWFDLAARGGDPDAGEERDSVANQMKPEELESAKKLSAEWKPE
jgi:TPR repeat protein